MSEKVKNKDAEPANAETDDLEQGLEETFPGSDAVSAIQPTEESLPPKDDKRP